MTSPAFIALQDAISVCETGARDWRDYVGEMIQAYRATLTNDAYEMKQLEELWNAFQWATTQAETMQTGGANATERATDN